MRHLEDLETVFKQKLSGFIKKLPEKDQEEFIDFVYLQVYDDVEMASLLLWLEVLNLEKTWKKFKSQE